MACDIWRNMLLFTVDNSPLDHSALFSVHIYNCSINIITDGEIINLVNKLVHNLVDDYQLHVAHFVRELVSLRQITMELSNALVCSRD